MFAHARVDIDLYIYIYIHFPKPTPTSLVEQRRAQTTRLDVLGQNLRRLDSRDLDEVLSPDQSAVRGEANVLARPQKPPCLPGDVATALPLPRLVRSRANRLVLFFFVRGSAALGRFCFTRVVAVRGPLFVLRGSVAQDVVFAFLLAWLCCAVAVLVARFFSHISSRHTLKNTTTYQSASVLIMFVCVFRRDARRHTQHRTNHTPTRSTAALGLVCFHTWHRDARRHTPTPNQPHPY